MDRTPGPANPTKSPPLPRGGDFERNRNNVTDLQASGGFAHSGEPDVSTPLLDLV